MKMWFKSRTCNQLHFLNNHYCPMCYAFTFYNPINMFIYVLPIVNLSTVHVCLVLGCFAHSSVQIVWESFHKETFFFWAECGRTSPASSEPWPQPPANTSGMKVFFLFFLANISGSLPNECGCEGMWENSCNKNQNLLESGDNLWI